MDEQTILFGLIFHLLMELPKDHLVLIDKYLSYVSFNKVTDGVLRQLILIIMGFVVIFDHRKHCHAYNVFLVQVLFRKDVIDLIDSYLLFG